MSALLVYAVALLLAVLVSERGQPNSTILNMAARGNQTPFLGS